MSVCVGGYIQGHGKRRRKKKKKHLKSTCMHLLLQVSVWSKPALLLSMIDVFGFQQAYFRQIQTGGFIQKLRHHFETSCFQLCPLSDAGNVCCNPSSLIFLSAWFLYVLSCSIVLAVGIPYMANKTRKRYLCYSYLHLWQSHCEINDGLFHCLYLISRCLSSSCLRYSFLVAAFLSFGIFCQWLSRL